MFADPQSVTINEVPISLPRVIVGTQDATYRNADETVQVRISHLAAKGRKRRMVRLDQTVVAEDPLTAENVSQKAGVYIVIDEPDFGFTDEDLSNLVLALSAFLSEAAIAQILGGES